MATSSHIEARILHRLEQFGKQLIGINEASGQMKPKKAAIFYRDWDRRSRFSSCDLVADGGQSSPFVTAIVKRGNVTATITVAGTIEPVEVVDIGAQVAGQISSFWTDKSGKPIDDRSTRERRTGENIAF